LFSHSVKLWSFHRRLCQRSKKSDVEHLGREILLELSMVTDFQHLSALNFHAKHFSRTLEILPGLKAKRSARIRNIQAVKDSTSTDLETRSEEKCSRQSGTDAIELPS
jgi:hypothetical protein